MKKRILTTLVLLAVVGIAQGNTIWSEDFSSPTLVSDPDAVNPDGKIYYPDEYSAGQWGRIAEASVYLNTPSGGDQRLLIRAGGTSATRGTAVTIDHSSFVGAGTYTLTFTIEALYQKCSFDVEIWETTSSPGNGFYVDTAEANGAQCYFGKNAASTATFNRLTELNYWQADISTISLNFTYDGTSDITLLFSTEANEGIAGQNAYIDDIRITTTIPVP